MKLPGLQVTRVIKICKISVDYQSSWSYQLLGHLYFPGVLKMHTIFIGYQNSQSYWLHGASIFSLDHQPSRLSSNLPGLPVTRGPQNAQNFHRLPRFPKLLITKAFMFALDHQPSRQSSSHLDYQFPRGLKMHKIFIGYQSSQSYSLLSRLFLLSCSKC